MKFVIIIHDMETIEIFYNAEEMVKRIVDLMNDHTIGRRKPKYLAVDERGIVITLDFE